MSVRSADAELDLIGFGSMVIDRMHRTRRILGPNEKGLLDPAFAGAPVESCIGGLMLNQLGWAALFGLRAGIFGRQADDDIGRALRGAMERAGLETHLDLSGSASSLAEIFIDHQGERAIYMAAGATAETTPSHVRDDHADFIARGKRLSTEISQLPLDTVCTAMRVAHEHGRGTALDLDVLPSDLIVTMPDRGHFELSLREADWLKPTALAARELFPEIAELDELAARIRAHYRCELVVITNGEAGSVLATREGVETIPACSVERVIDSTGAGDAFWGGFLAGEVLGLSLHDSALLGNACGAVCVERLGAFPDDADALRERVLERYGRALPAHARSAQV